MSRTVCGASRAVLWYFLGDSHWFECRETGEEMPVVIADRLQLVNYNKDVVSVELLQID